MNKIILIGNVVRDPELQQTSGGKNLCRFTLAVTRPFNRDATDFFACTAWEKKAELIGKYVQKGNKLGIIGRLEINETEKDGVKTRHHNIMVEDIEFLTPKTEPSESVQNRPEPTLTPADDNNLPF